MSLGARISAILSAAQPGAAPQVRTSPAFAARFQAEANRSGLSLDLAERDAAEQVRVCATCGAQNSPYVTECFNCQTELPRAPAPPPAAQALRNKLPEARWHFIAATPRLSLLPLLKVPLARARFAPPPAVTQVDGQQVLSRFLSVFIEREERRPAPASVARFDERTVLDKFLSLFVERG